MNQLTSVDSNPDTGKIWHSLRRLGKSVRIGQEERLLKTAKGEIHSAENNEKGAETISFDHLAAGSIIRFAIQSCLCRRKRMGDRGRRTLLLQERRTTPGIAEDWKIQILFPSENREDAEKQMETNQQ